jgi:hypothetical protein
MAGRLKLTARAAQTIATRIPASRRLSGLARRLPIAPPKIPMIPYKMGLGSGPRRRIILSMTSDRRAVLFEEGGRRADLDLVAMPTISRRRDQADLSPVRQGISEASRFPPAVCASSVSMEAVGGVAVALWWSAALGGCAMLLDQQ